MTSPESFNTSVEADTERVAYCPEELTLPIGGQYVEAVFDPATGVYVKKQADLTDHEGMIE